MKVISKTIMAICGLLMLAGSACAMDYTSLTTDELSRMRGTLYNASQEDWNAFHTEWQKRLGQMTPEQRQQYMGPGQGMGRGRGMGRGMGCCGPGWGRGWGPTATNQGK